MATEKRGDVTYRFGVFDFEPGNGQLRKQGRPVSLERQPARVLAVLLARAGELVSREELRDSVWGHDTHVDFDRGLAYCLSQIRGALGDRGDNPRFVQTFPRRGYKFISPLSVEPSPSPSAPPGPPALPALPAQRPFQISSLPVAWIAIMAGVTLVLLMATAWLVVAGRSRPVLVAVSIFDNETGVAEYDRPVAALADLVVADLTTLAPGRVDVIGNADALRRSRNIRNLKAVADAVHADYLVLGQLQQGEQGLRFITHFIRLRDMVHLKANRLPLHGDGLSGLEVAVVDEFERAVRQHVLTQTGN